MISITIDGEKITTDENKTILEVVKEQNLTAIPTLCHNPQLEPFTSCFLCVVDIQGKRNLTPSCATKVQEGMIIETNNTKIAESRKMNLELLLSNHYADCYPPCKLACPANVDIQGYLALTARGLFKEAQMLMKETNPLTLVCGRVCAKPCETACRRNYVDEPVAIKDVKRFLADRDTFSENPYIPPVKPDTGKKVAVIGSGPAGLSVAYFLRQEGHSVTIFEKHSEAGGMMRYGIPEYRLPKKDLQKEIDLILQMGVDIQFNQTLGQDFSIEDLFEKGFHSVFLGIGAQKGRKMGIVGEDVPQVMQGVEFLEKINSGEKITLYGKVFVIGGGNTAIDAARTALRSGAQTVTIVYRRTENEMPANREEIEDAKAEGIQLIELTNPVEFITKNNQLESVKLIKMQLGEPDASGRRRPVEIKNSEYREKVDFVIEAVGQKVEHLGLSDIQVNKNGTIAVEGELFLTNRKGVFAGGDAVTGPDIIIGAIAQGRKTAFVIDKFLKGEELFSENRLGFYIRKDDFKKLTKDDFSEQEKKSRFQIHKIPVEQRIHSFEEVELPYDEETVMKEAKRCMECGCQDIYECKLKEYSYEYQVDKMRFIGGQMRDNVYDTQNKFIVMNTAKCINCGQCVRVCDEVQKQEVFAFQKRGFDTLIVPYMNYPLDETNCVVCGACVSVCPVGAIIEKLPQKPGPFHTQLNDSSCNLCGDGCFIVVETRNENFIKISSKHKNDLFFDNLCYKGRFSYSSLFQRNAVPVLDVVSKIKSFKNPLVSLSPVLTIEEIETIMAFAKKNNFDIFSEELFADGKKNQIIKNISSVYNSDLPIVFYFGEITDEFNSVSFRKMIKNDKEKKIYLGCQVKDKYFHYTQKNNQTELFSELEEFDLSEVQIVIQWQTIDVEVFSKLISLKDIVPDLNIKILNYYPNYDYLLQQIGDLEQIQNKVRNSVYDSFIGVNNQLQSWQSYFQDYLVFSDRKSGNSIVPIPSIYEKEGHFYDQNQELKTIHKSVKTNLLSLSDYLQ